MANEILKMESIPMAERATPKRSKRLIVIKRLIAMQRIGIPVDKNPKDNP